MVYDEMTPDQLPLVLSGPLVRRAEAESVSVWIALRRAATVRIAIVDPDTGAELMTGEAHTVRIGEYVHVVCVTASGGPLEWGGLYEYDIRFPDLGEDLQSCGLLGEPGQDPATLRYAGFRLPSFMIPAKDIGGLRLLHGSCRKPHGEGADMLATVDHILARSAHDLTRRPQILMLTGDQVYADDVSDSLLHHLIDFGAKLFGWPGGEALPGDDSDHLWNTHPHLLKPGCRAELAENQGGLTGMLPNSPEKAKSHLLTFTEFAAVHLCAWSDAIWPERLPTFEQVHPEWAAERNEALLLKPYAAEFVMFNTERERLEQFRSTLPAVRRALANTATYMICDDHEITDDWYFNLAWCERVLTKPLGRAAIRNGLLAYAVFQAWGNTPEQFAPGAPGRELLDLIAAWTAAGGAPSLETERLLSIPRSEDLRQSELRHSARALDWHYSVHGPEDGYQLLVLDSRTMRGFPGESTDCSELISRAGIETQVSQLLTARPDGVVVVVSSTPVLGIPVMQKVQMLQNDFRSRLAYDVEFWKAQATAFEGLIAAFASSGTAGMPRKIVFLSGDVHFGFAAWLRYWADRPYRASEPSRTAAVFAQLNASPFKNQTTEGYANTCILHQMGYNPLFLGDPISTRRRWNGFNGECGPELVEVPSDGQPDDRRPDWQYQIGYVPSDVAQHPDPALLAYLEAAGVSELNEGQEIVGVNHIGEVTFARDGDGVTQELWWHWKNCATPYPLSRFVVSLKLDGQLS